MRVTNHKKKVLFIAPLPPPVTGQSVACKKIVDRLQEQFDFITINFSKSSFKAGLNSIGRILKVCGILRDVYFKSRIADVIYLTSSQSIAGNLKDLLTLCLVDRKKTIIHLHGGGLRKRIFDRFRLLDLMNRRVLKDIAYIIVLSDSLRLIYKNIISSDRIRVVNNFAEDYLFIDDKSLHEKYCSERLEIVYLSNMIESKGYGMLSDAIMNLLETEKAKVSVNFIGSFDNQREERQFRRKIQNIENIHFLGVIVGEQRRNHLHRAHLFCLPTFHEYSEGQPISILEAYASGCCVVTTPRGGIVDIFQNKINGFYVRKRSVGELSNLISNIINDGIESLKQYGLLNRDYAKSHFRVDNYVRKIENIFNLVANPESKNIRHSKSMS